LGSSPYMGTRAARVGFHAPRVNETSFDVSPGASANVGAHLYQIGITDFTTILSLRSPVPQSMRWLSFYGDALTYKLGTKELSMTEPRWAWAREALSGKPYTVMHLTRTTQKIALPAAAASLRYEKSSAGGRSGDAFERITAPMRLQIGRSRLANAPLRGRPMVQ